MQRTSGFSLHNRSIKSAFLFEIPWLFHCEIFVLEMIAGEDCLDFEFTSAVLLFFGLFTRTQPPRNSEESVLLFVLPFFLVNYPLVDTVGEFSSYLPKFS